jgi:hypothetical protein
MARILLTVSTKVSPFFTEEEAAEKFTTSALKRFSANSKERRVRVEFSKNKLAMVISLDVPIQGFLEWTIPSVYITNGNASQAG